MADGRKVYRDPARFNAFTDGVMVVSMTLLILNVELPPTVKGLDGAALFSALGDLGARFFGYVLSFIVIAQYWMGYTDYFGSLKKVDNRFAWLNILFLLVIGFVPFVTTLLGENDGRVATSIYAANLVLVSLTLVAMSAYATRHGLIDDIDPDESWLRHMTPWLKIAGVFGASIVVAQFQPTLAKLMWLLLALPDRWVTWPAKPSAA